MTNEEAQSLGAHCWECPLKGSPIVGPQVAKRRLKLVVVSDNPTRGDENHRRPLSGAGGKLLWIELGKRGVKEEDCHVTYANMCRGESDKENEKAAQCCAPRLLNEVSGACGASAPPILLLGKTPTRSVLASRKLGVSRGFVWRVPEGREVKAPEGKTGLTKAGKPRKVKAARKLSAKETLKNDTVRARNLIAGGIALPTLALSFVIKADTWAPVFRRDLDRVGDLVRGRPLTEMQEQGGNPDGIGTPYVLEALRIGPQVTCDIETDGVDPRTCKILCIGVSDLVTGRVGVVWPYKREYGPELSKWFAARSKVVFHNGFQFDLLVMRQHEVMW